MGDVEDPDLYADVPLYEFMQTEKGHWVKNNCADPRYIIQPDPSSFGSRVVVYGDVEEKNAVEWILRWGQRPMEIDL